MTKAEFRASVACLLLVLLCLSGCGEKDAYTPSGAFYAKTAPARGDRGAEEVLSLEAPYKTYAGDGDITVSMTAGLGHLPGLCGDGEDAQETFYVRYRILPLPSGNGQEPAWEKKVAYTDSFYDAKYDSTAQHNRSFLFMPRYGDFYPQYRETVDIVFPADVQEGRLYMELYRVVQGREDRLTAALDVSFERADGVLTLDP